MVKNIIIGVLGAIVLILSILGFSKYKKNNSVDIGLGVGNIGIGSGEYNDDNGGGFNIGGGKSKTKKGNWVKCYASSGTMSETIYFKLRNNKTSTELSQIKVVGSTNSDRIQKYGKTRLQKSLASYLCRDSSKPVCGNIKYKWSGNTVTLTGAYDLEAGGSYFVGLTYEEIKEKVSQEGEGTCEKVSSAPIYGTKLDPAGTYSNYDDSRNEIRQN